MAGIEIAVEAALRYIIKRPRLTRLLDEANARVLTLVAPAGFGKTTLAWQWAENRPHVWYRGTKATADVAALAARLVDAVSPVVPGAGSRMLQRMRATGTPEQDVEILAELFAEDLGGWPDGSWLVFDDYQFAMEAKAPERFVDLLVRKSPIRLLVTSRKRPGWATARRLLYGEVYELGRNDLAMNREEAAQVLAHRPGVPAAGLVALSEGWPAVIGLAALTDEFELPEGGLPGALYDYFADELYHAASPDVQRGLCRLALAPTLVEGVPQFLLGADAGPIVAEGIRLGFLTGRPGTLEFHPLLRTFLEEKTRETGHEPAEAHRLARHLAELGLWDDAFTLVERFFSRNLFVELVERGLSTILEDARLSTLARWLELATARRIDVPLVDLARAELAFHEARRRDAASLALRATRRLPEGHRQLSRAHYIAGLSSYLDFYHDRARACYDRALETAADIRSERDAVWGKLAVSLDLDLPDIEELQQRLHELDDGTAKSDLRLAIAQYLIAVRTGQPLHEIGDLLDSTVPVISMATDPHIVSSYLNSRGYMLILQGRYPEALDEAMECERYARNGRLPFLLGYARRLRALSELGLRHFGKCRQLLDWLDREAAARGDIYLEVEARLARSRLLISQRRAGEGVTILQDPPPRFPWKAERGEWLATLSMALACTGESRALEVLREAESLARTVEVRTLGPLVRAIVSISTEGSSAGAVAEAAFREVLSLGNVDAFVVAYRGFPDLLCALGRNPALRSELLATTEGARDWALATTAELTPRRQLFARGATLTSREVDVLELVSQGLTNKEIAKTLFISEGTAKAHVYHILEKLGVHTRTEAALRASRFVEGD